MNMIEQLMRERTAYRALIIGLVRNGGEGGNKARIAPYAMPQMDEKILIDVSNPDSEGVITITLREKKS